MTEKTPAEKMKALSKKNKKANVNKEELQKKSEHVNLDELKRDRELEQKAIDEVAKKLSKRILSGPQNELKKEIETRVKKIKLAEIIDRVLQKKECPWLKNDNWDCSKSGCVKNGKPECRTVDFINCPAVNHYFKNQMASKMMARVRKLEKGGGRN